MAPMEAATLLHLLLLALSYSHNLVSADESFIQNECHNANVCIQCLKSDEAAGSADRKGLAVILISCLIHQVEELGANMTQLASTATDPPLKAISQNCTQQYVSVRLELLFAKLDLLDSSKIDQVLSSLRAALMFHSSCHKAVEGYMTQKTSSSVPELLHCTSSNMVLYEELSDATRTIIERL